MKIDRKNWFSNETGKTQFFHLFFFYFNSSEKFSNICQNRTNIFIEMLSDPAIDHFRYIKIQLGSEA